MSSTAFLASAANGFYNRHMILACPSCHARYLISAQLFTAGPRQVRCARCSHGWEAALPPEIDAVGPTPDADLTPPPEAIAPIPAGSNLPAIRKKRLPPRLRRMLAIAGTLVLLAVLPLWLLLDRHQIVARWPALDRFYEAVGIHVYFYGEGLSFTNVRSDLHYDSGKMLLLVEGKVHNGSDSVLKIPDIMATAIGVDGKTVQSWRIDSPATIVFPGEAAGFESSIDAPKDAVAEINLSLLIESTNDSK